MTRNTSDFACFHCGLPIQLTKPPTLTVHDQFRSFCCHGCHAVCNAIVESGNDDYYQYRESKGSAPAAEDLPGLLGKLKIYDKDEIQRDFVQQGEGWKEAWLIFEEIRCAACMWLNERTLRQLEGVVDVQMDYTGQQARIRWQPEQVRLSDILEAITRIGYVAHPFDPRHREALNKEQEQRGIRRILFALILGMMVMQSAISSYFFGASNEQGEYPLWITLSRWSSLVATALILGYSGQLFFRNSWRDLKNRNPGMDVPIALGLSIAWLGSLLSTVTGRGEVYFESITMFVLFIMIARYVELRARIDATALLDRAGKIIPPIARRKQGGEYEDVAVIELKPGDQLQLLPGETVPVDGVLLSEASLFDESLLSGESLPVRKQRGEQILGGAINVEQPIELEVQTTSNHSTLNKLQQLTQQSIHDKPYYVDLAEGIAGKFVVGILLLAAFTLLYWFNIDPDKAIGHTVAVLIVTCPCALALAAPVALSLGAAGLSRLNMIALRMSAVEEVQSVNTFVFDKTGTLTEGEPGLHSILKAPSPQPLSLTGRGALFGGSANGSGTTKLSLALRGRREGKRSLTTTTSEANDYLALAATLEKHSEHPFAKALRNAAPSSDETEEIKVDYRQNHPGKGIEAVISGQTWRLGSESFAAVNLPEDHTYKEQLTQLREQGLSLLYLSNEEGVQAVFCLQDPLREGIQNFLGRLPTGSRCVVLSGDHSQSVKAVAKRLGITEAYGDLSPQDKLNWIQEQQQQGRCVMMFGDGINDAPTLAAANVSVAFSDATDLAKSHSDLVILGRDFQALPAAFGLMRKTRRIIIQNLAWALGYNLLAIPAAVLGYVTPWMAALGMSLSSFIVVMNSLRLRS